MSIRYSATWTAIPDNLSSQLMQHGGENTQPEKVIYEEAITGKTASYGPFHRQIRQTAYSLRQTLSLGPGNIVSISASSCIDYILTAHAVWWAGGVVSPINNTLHIDEITHALDLIKSRIFIVDETLYGKIPAIKEGSHHARQPKMMEIFTIGSNVSKDWPRLPLVSLPSDTKGLELHNPTRANKFDARNTCAAINFRVAQQALQRQ